MTEKPNIPELPTTQEVVDNVLAEEGRVAADALAARIVGTSTGEDGTIVVGDEVMGRRAHLSAKDARLRDEGIGPTYW